MGLWQSVGTQAVVWGFWGAVENYGVRTLLACVYECPVRRFRFKRPAPHTVAATAHWHAMRIVVAVVYLLYCVIRNSSSMPVSAYTVLHVTPFADESEIRRQFRHFAKVYHPDKAGPQHEGVFLALRRAYATLSDPVKRFAYDR